MVTSMRHQLAATTAAPGQARRLVGDALATGGSADDGEPDMASAQLAVSELVTNALRYGRAPARLHPIELRLEHRHGRLRVSVLDPGVGGGPRRRPANAHGGWGLEIVDRVALAWGYGHEGGRTLVWFEV
jgi:anti-sigma regulatory factor (Ser/Thr protein kinase)